MLLKCYDCDFPASLIREEDSETWLHWASVDWYNICSALNQTWDFHYRGSWVRPLHRHIIFWSGKCIYPINNNNSPQNTRVTRPLTFHRKSCTRSPLFYFYTEYETDSGMHRLLHYSDLSQHRFYSSINVSDPLLCSPSVFYFFSFFAVRESGNE